ncbi:MAG: DNA polymerase III subunit beta [Deltaproteobacteria bacterium]|nr:DNA polymerase III subunit beta [Deltaproteobacteria bacterium]
MELRIKKTNFLNLLRWSQGIVERKSTMLILSNLLIDVASQKIKITATDLEVVLSAEGEVEGKGSGRWVVSARHLYELVREAPQEEIRLSTGEGLGLNLTSGKAEFRIVGMKPDDFPQLPSISSKDEIKVDADDLSEMIENTAYAVSTDETRYNLNGLYFVGLQEKEGQNLLRVVATDGHRLSYSERGIDKKWKLGKGLLIPRKGVQELKKLLAEGSGELTVALDDKGICFHRGPVMLLVRLIEAEYPAYEQVIPKGTDRVVSVGRELVMGALKRASILASAEGRGVRLDFSSNLLKIFSSNPEMGETREEIPVDYKGQKFEVAFNPRYLVDVLAVLEDEKVVLELKDEVSPCVIRSEFDRGFLALVMPMRV